MKQQFPEDSSTVDTLNQKISTLEARNRELEQELATLKDQFHSVDEKRRMYRKTSPLKKEEDNLSSLESGKSISRSSSSRIKKEHSDEEIEFEEPAGVVIGLYGSQHPQPASTRVELGIAIPSTVQTSSQGVEFHSESTHEAEDFLLRRLDQVAPLDGERWSSRGIFVLDYRSIIWLGPSQECALVLVPKTQSCPCYSLLSPYDSFSGQTRELFVQKTESLHYAGSYSCGDGPAGMGSRDKDFKGDRGVMTHLMAKACYDMQTQPESERLSVAEFEVLCDEGKIRAEWIAFRCVGFDQAFCDDFTAGMEENKKIGKEREVDLGKEIKVEDENEEDGRKLARPAKRRRM